MNKAIKNYLYILFVQCGNYIFPIMTIPLVSRVFGPSLIGELNYIQYIIGYFVLFISYSFNYTGVRRLTRGYGNKNEVFFTIFYCQTLLLILLTVIYVSIAKIWGGVINSPLAWISYLTCLATIFQQNWFFQAVGDFKVITYSSVVSKAISVVLILLFIKNKGDILLYACLLQGTLLASSLFGFFYAIFYYKLKVVIVKWSECVRFFKEDVYIFISGLLANMYTVTGVVILGALANTTEVGLYTSAQKIIDLMRNVLLIPLNMLFFPMISSAFKSDRQKGVKIFQSLMPIFIMFTISSLIIIEVFGNEIISIMFGPKFINAIILLKILAVGFVFLFIGTVIGSQLILNLQYDVSFVKMQLIIAVFSLTANFMFAKKWGSVSIAIVWTLSEFIMTAMQIKFLYSRKIMIFKKSSFSLCEIKQNAKKILSLK